MEEDVFEFQLEEEGDNFDIKYKKKMETYEQHYSIEELNDANDLTLLQILIKTEIMIDDLQKRIQQLIEDNPIRHASNIKKLSDLLRDATRTVTDLQKTLAIDRKTRKEQETSGDISSYIRHLKTIAGNFLEDRMVKVYCNDCKVMVGRISPVHSYTSYNCYFQCSQCGKMINTKRKEKNRMFDIKDSDWRTYQAEIIQPDIIRDTFVDEDFVDDDETITVDKSAFEGG